MPEAVSFRVTTYHKLAKGETGLTQMNSNRLAASEVIAWALEELPEQAWSVGHDDAGDVMTLVIDWSRVPESVRNPVMPGRMR